MQLRARARAAVSRYEQGKLSEPEPYTATVSYSDAYEAWFLYVAWIYDEAEVIPRIEVFDKNGDVVGVFESRRYPREELPSNKERWTMIRYDYAIVSGPGETAPEDRDVYDAFDVEVPPSEIVGLFLVGDDYTKYVAVREREAE